MFCFINLSGLLKILFSPGKVSFYNRWQKYQGGCQESTRLSDGERTPALIQLGGKRRLALRGCQEQLQSDANVWRCIWWVLVIPLCLLNVAWGSTWLVQFYIQGVSKKKIYILQGVSSEFWNTLYIWVEKKYKIFLFI